LKNENQSSWSRFNFRAGTSDFFIHRRPRETS